MVSATICVDVGHNFFRDFDKAVQSSTVEINYNQR